MPPDQSNLIGTYIIINIYIDREKFMDAYLSIYMCIEQKLLTTQCMSEIRYNICQIFDNIISRIANVCDIQLLNDVFPIQGVMQYSVFFIYYSRSIYLSTLLIPEPPNLQVVSTRRLSVTFRRIVYSSRITASYFIALDFHIIFYRIAPIIVYHLSRRNKRKFSFWFTFVTACGPESNKHENVQQT